MNKLPTVADVRGILKPYKRTDEMAELRAANERLRAALEPFAAVACVFDPDMIGGTMPHTGPWQSWPRTINGEMVMYELTVEHLRNARAALGEENSDE